MGYTRQLQFFFTFLVIAISMTMVAGSGTFAATNQLKNATLFGDTSQFGEFLNK